MSSVDTTSALSIRDVHHSYVRGSVWFRKSTRTEVLKGISLDIPEGSTLGLVGESGCGKTTLVKAILRLIEPTSGQVLLRSGDHGKQQDILSLPKPELKKLRQELQVVFQDPYGSLNPRMSVYRTISEPLTVHLGLSTRQAKQRVGELMELVGLNPKVADRYPHEFSGGQRQRVGIARALAFDPKVLILDEPVSALDVSVQAQILNLIIGLQQQLSLTYLFVSHDLAVVEHIADQVAVMYLGRIVELGDSKRIFRDPAHPYTQALLSASPIPDVQLERRRTRITLHGDVSTVVPPAGCQFSPRCPVGDGNATCTSVSPALVDLQPDHQVSCHFPRGWQQ